MIIHKYKIEGKALCNAKQGDSSARRGLWFIQNNDYTKATLGDELCQKCWDWLEEANKLHDDIVFMKAHPHLYNARETQVLLGYKEFRFNQLGQDNIPL